MVPSGNLLEKRGLAMISLSMTPDVMTTELAEF